MAEQKESSLIGYDPLAWMHDKSGDNADSGESVLSQTTSDSLSSEQFEAEPLEKFAQQIPVAADDIDQQEQSDQWPDPQSDAVVIVLDSVLNIQNVLQLHSRLVSAIDSYDKIEIDASAVTAIDTANMQLLVILKQTAIKLQKDVVFDFPSDKFIEAANLLGLSEMLEVDKAASGFF